MTVQLLCSTGRPQHACKDRCFACFLVGTNLGLSEQWYVLWQDLCSGGLPRRLQEQRPKNNRIDPRWVLRSLVEESPVSSYCYSLTVKSKTIRTSVKPSKEMTCAAFACNGNWSQLDSASSRPADLRDISRKEMQSQHVMQVKPVIVRRVGSDLSTCCQPNCAMFDCKAGCRAVWVLGLFAELLFLCCVRSFQFCNCWNKRSRHAVVSWAGCWPCCARPPWQHQRGMLFEGPLKLPSFGNHGIGWHQSYACTCNLP